MPGGTVTVHRDVFETPMCPDVCTTTQCPHDQHEHIEDGQEWAGFDARFVLIMMRLRKAESQPPLTFLRFAGVALMVNSERRSLGPVPLNWFEPCSTCGAGTEGCLCEPNLLAILAQEEGGSEWQS